MFLPALFLGLAAAPLTLEEAIQIAQSQDREVVKAKADLLLIDVERARALANVLPRVDLTVQTLGNWAVEPLIEQRVPLNNKDVNGYNEIQVTNNYLDPLFRNTLTARQLIWDGGRWWAVLSRVDDLEAQRQAALRLVQNNLRLQVVRAFFDHESAKRGVEAFEERVSASTTQAERARELIKSGQGSAQDAANAERNLAEDRLTLARRVFTQRRAARTFNLALARPADTPFELILPASINTATTTAPLQIPGKAVAEAAAQEHRPELALSRAQLQFLDKNRTIVASDYFPNVSVGGTYTRFSRRPDRAYADPTDNFYAGLDLTVRWNLFRGLGTNADVDEVELQILKAEADYQERERVVLSEVQDRLENLALQLQSFELAQSSLRTALDAIRLVRALFGQGKNTAVELRAAENAYLRAQLSVIQTRFDLEVARESLRQSVGIDLLEAP